MMMRETETCDNRYILEVGVLFQVQAHCINKGIKISLYLKRFYNLTCNVRNLENSFVRRGLLAPRKRALGIPEEKDFKEGERKGGRHQVYQRFFLPDERNSQVGLGSVRKGASSSIFPRINLLFGTKYKKRCWWHWATNY